MSGARLPQGGAPAAPGSAPDGKAPAPNVSALQVQAADALAHRRPRGMSMTAILVLVVVSLFAAALVVSVTLIVDRYEKAVIESARTGSAQTVAQVTGTVGRYTQDMQDVMGLLTAALADDTVDRDEFFRVLFQMRPDVIAVSRYAASGQLLDCWAQGGRAPREESLENLTFGPALAAQLSGEEGYISAPHVETIFKGYYPWVVTMAVHLKNAGGGWLALDISFSGISSDVSNTGIGPHGYCYIMDEGGAIVYHPQQQLLYSGLKTEDTAAVAGLADGSYATGSVIYSVQSVQATGWRVVGISYVDELVTSSVADMLRIAVLIASGTLLATLFSSLVLSRVLSLPLLELTEAMESFEQDAGHFTYHAPAHGFREVRELSDSFGHMVLQIQQLMEKVREEEINLRKTELKALQAQINPHFLYNTLDSIAWMCEAERSADAVKMVHALATLFRISISRGQELIPIARELEHAKSYLQIQKYRYKNQFEYEFHVDESCFGYLCNKITLQPIIENAIVHGLDVLVDEGRIDITVQPDGGDILFVVEDNGVGMSRQQVDEMLRRGPADRTGIGIKNVNDRLRIYFGEGYGLRIESEPDVGTKVIIRMPKVEEGRYEAK